MKKNALCRLTAAVGAVVLLVPVFAADLQWQGTSGGNMDNLTNWGVAAIGASDHLQVNKAQSNPLTLLADWSPYRFSIQPGAGTTTILDLKDHSLLATDRIFVEKGSTLWLTNGVFGCQPGADRIFIGDGTSPIISCSNFNTTHRTYSRKPTLRVEVDGLQRIGQSMTLVETANAITDADWNNLKAEVPEGVTVVREEKRIVAKVASTLGTMLIVR